MLKNICRWLTVALPLGLVLPLFVTTWSYFLENSTTTPKTYGLFDSFDGLEFVAWGNSFQSIWLTLFAIFAVTTLVVGIGMAVMFLLDNLKVTKFQKYERLVVIVFTVLFVLGFAFGTVATIVNIVEIVGLVNGIYGEIGLTLFMIFGAVSSIVGFFASCPKKVEDKK